MSLIVRLAAVATVLVSAGSLWVAPAKADHHASAQATTTQPQKTATKCTDKCRQYGWPSYLLSFPPARSR
jgi:hypothetical protein